MEDKQKKPMTKAKAHLFFLFCLIFEQLGNLIISYTKGFAVLWPSLACLLMYFLCFFFFGKSLKVLNLGVAYAIWGGVSIVFMAVISVTVLHLELTRPDIIGITIIVIGVICMDMWGVKEAPAKKEPDEPEENSQT